jgi:hypothetical protein
MGSMLMNIAANMLGLGNAATPLGLRAMKDLESLNPRPGTATNAMCTFLAINTSSVQLIPVTAIAILAANRSSNPTAIVGTSILATACAAISAVAMSKFLAHLPMFSLPLVPAASPSPPLEERVGERRPVTEAAHEETSPNVRISRSRPVYAASFGRNPASAIRIFVHLPSPPSLFQKCLTCPIIADRQIRLRPHPDLTPFQNSRSRFVLFVFPCACAAPPS